MKYPGHAAGGYSDMIRIFGGSGFAAYVAITGLWGLPSAFWAFSWLIMIDVIGENGSTWAHLKFEI